MTSEREGAMNTLHATRRAQQRCLPPLVEEWLDRFGEEEYDGHGGVITFFSRASRRAMQREFGRGPVRKFAEYFGAYKVESSHDGRTLTVGHRTKRINRK
jgi:hypothetical protein